MTGDLGITATSIWDVGIAGGSELANLPAPGVWGAVAFTPDGRYLMATGPARSITLWDAQTFTGVRSLGEQDPPAPPPHPRRAGGVSPPTWSAVVAIDVSRDSRLAAAVRSDGSLRVWDVQTGRDAFTFDASPSVTDVAWDPDGDLLAFSTGDNRHGRLTAVDSVGRDTDRTGRVIVVDRSGRVVTVLQEEAVSVSARSRSAPTARGSSRHACQQAPSTSMSASS